MENYSKIINAVTSKLDWDSIMEYYKKIVDVEETTDNKIKPKSLASIKKELHDLIKFVLDSNFKELHHKNWIIYMNSDNGFRLEVVFAPTRSVYTEGDEVEEPLPIAEEVEKDVLGDMLKKAVAEENYELAQAIHNRLKRMEKQKKAVSIKK